eukprot:gene10648-22230_t
METVFTSVNKESSSGIELLTCVVQNYAWGKVGSESLAGRLKHMSDPSFDFDETEPCAELWMGTHPNGPAKIMRNGEYLLDWLKSFPEAIGTVPNGYPADELPFMLKVLSIRTALSIQAHPDKALGRKLHANFPKIYKDPNHKPEMAVALTPFEAMCGFRPISEIKTNIIKFPELRHILGLDVTTQFMSKNLHDNSEDQYKKLCLQRLFRGFMECNDDIANNEIKNIISRLSHSPLSPLSRRKNGHSSVLMNDDQEDNIACNDDHMYVQELILRLHEDFPADRGVICPLLLNCIQLSIGEAFFMGPDEPHAYISGDCIECMALSDNTVRAGLTPKFKDVETLCTMLHYNSGKPTALLDPIALDPYTFLYRPPVSLCAEFEVERCLFPSNTTVANSPPTVPCGSFLIVIRGFATVTVQGETLELSEGRVVYIAASMILQVSTTDLETEMYRAHVNLSNLNYE